MSTSNIIKFPTAAEPSDPPENAKEYSLMLRIKGDEVQFKFFPPLIAMDERRSVGDALLSVDRTLTRTRMEVEE